MEASPSERPDLVPDGDVATIDDRGAQPTPVNETAQYARLSEPLQVRTGLA
jgi:hypothetical protein